MEVWVVVSRRKGGVLGVSIEVGVAGRRIYEGMGAISNLRKQEIKINQYRVPQSPLCFCSFHAVLKSAEGLAETRRFDGAP